MRMTTNTTQTTRADLLQVLACNGSPLDNAHTNLQRASFYHRRHTGTKSGIVSGSNYLRQSQHYLSPGLPSPTEKHMPRPVSERPYPAQKHLLILSTTHHTHHRSEGQHG